MSRDSGLDRVCVALLPKVRYDEDRRKTRSSRIETLTSETGRFVALLVRPEKSRPLDGTAHRLTIARNSSLVPPGVESIPAAHFLYVPSRTQLKTSLKSATIRK
jgi:hypothetical protein